MASKVRAQPQGKIIAVRVTESSRCILDWYAIKVEDFHTFSSLFELVVDASTKATPACRFKKPISVKENTYIKCQIQGSLTSEPIEVGWSLNVNETVETFCCGKSSFHLLSNNEICNPIKNAFTELFNAQNKPVEKLKYPSTFGADSMNVSRGDWLLKNDFISLLKDHEMGFVTGENTIGKTVVNEICDCLFYILPHLNKLSGRSHTLPSLFNRFYDSKTLIQTYNDPSKYKHKIKQMEKNKLNIHIQGLFKVLSLPVLDTKRMSLLKDAIFKMANDLSKYVEYMSDQQKKSLDIHNLPNPARSPNDGVHTRLRHIPGSPRNPDIANRYRDIEDCLCDSEKYEPISLSEYCPVDRKKRYDFVKGLVLPFDITLYHYSRGGPYEDLRFVWKCDRMLDMQMANKVIHQLEKDIPIHHTRAMRRDFREKFGLVAKTSPVVMDEMYQYLTGDKSLPSNESSKGIKNRLRIIIDTQNPDIVLDLRALHETKHTQFDVFFDEVEKFIQEYELKAVDDRRHGLISHMAVAMSVADLHRQICKRLPQDTPTPSVEYLRLQFMPKNQHVATAVQYTGRFNLKFRIQSRQFNQFHIDSHYVSALQKYLKNFAVKYRDNCVLLSVDDKNHIPVGEPGVPIATVFRGKKSLSHTEILNIAADHDTSAKLKLTPSVCLDIAIPENPYGDFYNGQVSVSLKDTIFKPSNPLRHVAEMRDFLVKTGSFSKPIRLIYSDGGPDHRITYPSVKLALITMFLFDDLDYLLAMRTAPHQSYRNWVERIMSILNLALQTQSVEREKMQDRSESLLKNLGSMNAIRTMSEKHEYLKDDLEESLKPVINKLNELFSRLQLKEKSFMIGEPARQELIEEIWLSLSTVDDTVQRSDTTAKQLKNKEKLNKFLEHCTVSRKYYFLVRKCGQPTCSICRPPRFPSFDELRDFPDPEPRSDDSTRFEDFDALYGKQTTEKYCPSLSQMLFPSDSSGVVVKMTAETARSYICCIDCNRPRCVYSSKKLSNTEKADLEILREEVIYTCGGNLTAPDTVLHDILMIQPNITCAAPVCAHYYSNRLPFDPVCYNCGNKEVEPIPNELKISYQSVHPVCKDCKDKQVKERTRGAKKLRKN